MQSFWSREMYVESKHGFPTCFLLIGIANYLYPFDKSFEKCMKIILFAYGSMDAKLVDCEREEKLGSIVICPFWDLYMYRTHVHTLSSNLTCVLDLF